MAQASIVCRGLLTPHTARSPRQHALPLLAAQRARRCTLRVRSDGAASADVSSEEEVEAVSLPEAPTAFRQMSQPEHQGGASPPQGALGQEEEEEEEGSPHIFSEVPSLLISDKGHWGVSSYDDDGMGAYIPALAANESQGSMASSYEDMMGAMPAWAAAAAAQSRARPQFSCQMLTSEDGMVGNYEIWPEGTAPEHATGASVEAKAESEPSSAEQGEGAGVQDVE